MQQNILFEVDSDFLNVKLDFNPLGALLISMFKENYFKKYSIPEADKYKHIVIVGYGALRNEFPAGPVSDADL